MTDKKLTPEELKNLRKRSEEEYYGGWAAHILLSHISAQEAEIAAVREALSGRTVSCSECNRLAGELADMRNMANAGWAMVAALKSDYDTERKRADALARECERKDAALSYIESCLDGKQAMRDAARKALARPADKPQ